MDEDASLEFSLPQDILSPVLSASNSYSLEKALENLIEVSRTDVGRKDLASKKILSAVLQLSQSLPYPSGCRLLTLPLKLLRNLCAGEVANQDAFIEQNGVNVVSTVLRSGAILSNPDYGTVRMGLQVLACACLAGEEHQHAVWNCFFLDDFVLLMRVRSQKTCDPLCMVLYTCCDGSTRLFKELCSDFIRLPIVEEIVRTASAVGFREDWLKLILSRICLEEPHYPRLFSKLSLVGAANVGEDTEFKDDIFLPEQAFLSRIVSEILNERIDEIFVPSDFSLFVFEICKRSVEFANSIP